jgi:hypothetical protein
MKTGQSLEEIARMLTEQKPLKKDYVAPTSKLLMDAASNLSISGIGQFELTDLAHGQLAERVGIPQKYYDRMKAAAPELLAQNVNTWFRKEPESRLLRTMTSADGKSMNRVRSIHSKRYRPLDNYDLAEAVLPEVEPMGCRIESGALTEGHLYLKLVTERITAKVVGDVVQMGIVISNSEVGLGSVKVEPMIWTLACRNGMIAADWSMRKYHIGRSGAEGDMAAEYFRDETRHADDKAFWMKVRDTVKGSLKQDVFERIVDKLKGAGKDKITGDAEEAVVVVQERFGLAEEERKGVLKHLLSGGDLSRYGMLNAITRASQDLADYERATFLERTGGEVLELPKQDWRAIAEAK